MIQARTLTSEAEMRANAVAVRARCFYPKAAPKLRLVEPVVKQETQETPSWKLTPMLFDAHAEAYRAHMRIQEMVSAGEIEIVNMERPTITQIVMEVLKDFPGITIEDLKSAHRTRKFVTPRHVAMYEVYKRRPDLSYPRIGKWFGGRDHTTLISAVRKIEAQKSSETMLIVK